MARRNATFLWLGMGCDMVLTSNERERSKQGHDTLSATNYLKFFDFIQSCRIEGLATANLETSTKLGRVKLKPKSGNYLLSEA